MGRRRFLALAAFPLILPSGALGQPGRPGANERLVTGHIGIGARGRALLERLHAGAAAVCDVDQFHLRDGAGIIGPGVRLFNDYRALLDERDIDAVVIATPDHWHALQAIHACEAGKDVFLETPAVRLPGEMVHLMRAATWFGRVVHAGPQSAIVPSPAPVASAQVTGPENLSGGSPKEDAAPLESLDWDRWLGPASPRPFNPACAHYQWRWVRDLGGGQIRVEGADFFARALAGLAPGGSLPAINISATGNSPAEGIWNCPRQLQAAYAMEGGRTLTWTTVEGGPTALRMDGDAIVLDEGGDETAVLGVRMERWLQAIRRREYDTTGLERACAAGVLGTLANAAVRLNRGFSWDPATGALGDTQAERLLAFTGRGDYTL